MTAQLGPAIGWRQQPSGNRHPDLKSRVGGWRLGLYYPLSSPHPTIETVNLKFDINSGQFCASVSAMLFNEHLSEILHVKGFT